MADHNESPGTTENSFPQEFINTTDAEEEEFLYSELPHHSFHDPNASENNRRNRTLHEDDVEQRGFDYYGTSENEYEENGAARSRLFKDIPTTYDDRRLYAHRRHRKVKTRPFIGHYFVKDYLRAMAAKSARNQPSQPHHFQPHPSHPHSARMHPAQIHSYLNASPAPYQDQVVSLRLTEQPDPQEPNVGIVYVATEQLPKRPNYLRRTIACSNCLALFCCFPIGILTIYLSYQAKTLWLKGDYSRAKSYYIAALILDIIGVVLGIVLPVVILSIFGL